MVHVFEQLLSAPCAHNTRKLQKEFKDIQFVVCFPPYLNFPGSGVSFEMWLLTSSKQGGPLTYKGTPSQVANLSLLWFSNHLRNTPFLFIVPKQSQLYSAVIITPPSFSLCS